MVSIQSTLLIASAIALVLFVNGGEVLVIIEFYDKKDKSKALSNGSSFEGVFHIACQRKIFTHL